jgi:hypothetical protein
MRIPRLYNEYRAIHDKLIGDKIAEIHHKSKYVKAAGELTEEGIDAINTALKIQFNQELDVGLMKQDFLLHIDK